MSNALPIEILTATIRWSETGDAAVDGLLPPFGPSLLQAGRSQLERAGPRALLTVTIRELIPDGAKYHALLRCCKRDIVAHISAGEIRDIAPGSDEELHAIARYLAYQELVAFAARRRDGTPQIETLRGSKHGAA